MNNDNYELTVEKFDNPVIDDSLKKFIKENFEPNRENNEKIIENEDFFIQKGRKFSLENEIPEDVIASGKRLVLKVVQSNHLKPGMKISINPGGLANSPRHIKDGIVYFGKENRVKF